MSSPHNLYNLQQYSLLTPHHQPENSLHLANQQTQGQNPNHGLPGNQASHIQNTGTSYHGQAFQGHMQQSGPPGPSGVPIYASAPPQPHQYTLGSQPHIAPSHQVRPILPNSSGPQEFSSSLESSTLGHNPQRHQGQPGALGDAQHHNPQPPQLVNQPPILYPPHITIPIDQHLPQPFHSQVSGPPPPQPSSTMTSTTAVPTSSYPGADPPIHPSSAPSHMHSSNNVTYPGYPATTPQYTSPYGMPSFGSGQTTAHLTPSGTKISGKPAGGGESGSFLPTQSQNLPLHLQPYQYIQAYQSQPPSLQPRHQQDPQQQQHVQQASRQTYHHFQPPHFAVSTTPGAPSEISSTSMTAQQSLPPQANPHFHPNRHVLQQQGMFHTPPPPQVKLDAVDSRFLPDKNFMSHFKPIQTKKNSRPRINKLNKNDNLILRKINSELKSTSSEKKGNKQCKIIQGELSLDQVFQHFQQVMKIERPIDEVTQQRQFGASYQLRIKNELEAQLLDLFIHRLSKSIDIFLPQDIFKLVIPELSLYDDTGMILDSIYCLSSLIFQRSAPDKIDPSIPVKYYHQSIRSIRYYLSVTGIEDDDKGIISRCLLSTILLCVYELFFVAVDSTYVKGASSILTSILSRKKNADMLKDSPFHQTCFWAMFLCDLILSLKYDLPSMYSRNDFWKPFDPEYFAEYSRPSHVDLDEMFSREEGNIKEEDSSNGDGSNADSDGDSNSDADIKILNHTQQAKRKYDKYISDLILSKEDTLWWLHKSLLNFSEINEFNNQVNVITKEDFETNQPYQKWLTLKKLLDEFEDYMPLNSKPIIYKPSSSNNSTGNSNPRVFPIIFFKDETTAVTVLNYKLAKIALYEALILKPNQDDIQVQQQIASYPDDYREKIAKDILGIMRTYDLNLNVWSVNVHTIRQVAKYVTHDPEAYQGWLELVERVIEVLHLRVQIRGGRQTASTSSTSSTSSKKRTTK